ncbi:MAG: cytochrome c biogenesis protein CcdA [Gemmatimonadaceae bacterium]
MPIRSFFRGAVMLAAATLGATLLGAQERPIKWTLAKPTAPITQGVAFTAQLHAVIPPTWHLYSMTQPPGGPVATVISLPFGSTFTMNGKVRAPDPDVALDPNFNILTETYADSVTFPVPLVARSTGRNTLAVTVAFQTCTDRFCLPPTKETLEVTLSVAAAPPGAVIPATDPVAPTPAPNAATTVANAPAAPSPAPANAAISPTNTAAAPFGGSTQSLPLFLWLAAVMGALSLLTPCVFPMIPITVSYFTRTSETTRSSPARNALIYAGGIMATFTVLGMAIALLVGAGGINRFAANPWVNLLVTAIFIAFALNLFGVWQFTLPSSLLTRLTAASNSSRGGETVGILAMGLTFTLTSFTCTAPFVGTLLVMAAQGDWQWPLLGLLVFSAVFALPFFLLAMMPSAIAKLPRSGSWLNSVKVIMGFIEIATAMKFLANADLVWQWGVFTRNVVLMVWIVTAVLAAAYLAGVFTRARPRPRIGPLQYGFAVACIAIALVLGRGLRGGRLGELESFLPPPEGAVTAGIAAVNGELSWMVNDYAAGLARAKAENKWVLIDFTGYTCTNCRWMEANMFPRAEITKEMERFVRVRLYTDGQGELYRTQQKFELDKFGTVALPYYAIVDSEGNTKSQFLGMTRSSDEFLTFLRAGQ